MKKGFAFVALLVVAIFVLGSVSGCTGKGKVSQKARFGNDGNNSPRPR